MDRVDELEARLEERHDQPLSEEPLSLTEDASASPRHDEMPNSPLHDATAPLSTDTSDTATVLEFLAWGRKKDVDYGSSPEHTSGPRRFSVEHDTVTTSNIITENSRDAQLDVLEALLPNRDLLSRLVEYHNSSVLWYHGSYSSTIFNQDLHLFLTEYESNIRSEELNLQWLGLLFSIITGSITCAPSSVRQSWGLSLAEKTVLSQRWYDATVTCLNLAGYVENHLFIRCKQLPL